MSLFVWATLILFEASLATLVLCIILLRKAVLRTIIPVFVVWLVLVTLSQLMLIISLVSEFT